MTLFTLYKSVLAFPALEIYYLLFFSALTPVAARPFEHSASVPYSAEEREKGISCSSCSCPAIMIVTSAEHETFRCL